jgi:acid phosphatase class B
LPALAVVSHDLNALYTRNGGVFDIRLPNYTLIISINNHLMFAQQTVWKISIGFMLNFLNGIPALKVGIDTENTFVFIPCGAKITN